MRAFETFFASVGVVYFVCSTGWVTVFVLAKRIVYKQWPSFDAIVASMAYPAFLATIVTWLTAFLLFY